MKQMLCLINILLLSFLLMSCSHAYRNFEKRIALAVTPKEIFDIDADMRFTDINSTERKEIQEQLALKGLQVFTNYTRAMFQGTVIADKEFITSILQFLEENEKYIKARQKDIYKEVIKGLYELLTYVEKHGG